MLTFSVECRGLWEHPLVNLPNHQTFKYCTVANFPTEIYLRISPFVRTYTARSIDVAVVALQARA